MTGPDRFRFLSIERSVPDSAAWERSDVPKLWLYHLHYFDDLVADGARERRKWHEDLIRRWIAENPPGCSIGWDPYPVSLRIVNWIQWALGGNTLSDEALNSLATQARWLRRRMEIHLLGNHLWANAKALVFAGLFFEGPEADAWLKTGLSTLQAQLDEQILADGGHFERSPMYHAIVLADLIDLIQLAEVFHGVVDRARVQSWRGTARRMLRWMRVMTHPDGGIAFFNDAALDAAPTHAQLSDYADQVGVQDRDSESQELPEIQALPDSGYVRLQRGVATLIADVGAIGPDYQPGHAHADTLSFELSLYGRRVFVNGGTSTYEPGSERLRQRGTASHNTVVINGQDSSEVWSSFRVARRARPLPPCWGIRDGRLFLQGAHDGYSRLTKGLTHTRRWYLSSEHLVVEDDISGPFTTADAMLLLAPEIDAQLEDHGAVLRWDGHEASARVENALMSVTWGTWHPRFGVTLASRRLRIRAQRSQFRTLISWRDRAA